MTDHPPTPVPDRPPTPAPRDPRRLGWILGIVGAFVVGIVLGGVGGIVGAVTVASIGHGSGESATPAAAQSYDPDGTLDTTMPTEDPSTSFQYAADQFTITLKITSKECFGSAGCVVTVKPSLAMTDTSVIPDSASGALTYEIVGGKDGPVTDTTSLTGTSYTIETSTVQTSSSAKKLTVRITDVQTYN